MSIVQVFSHVLCRASHHPTVFAGASPETGILLPLAGGRAAGRKSTCHEDSSLVLARVGEDFSRRCFGLGIDLCLPQFFRAGLIAEPGDLYV